MIPFHFGIKTLFLSKNAKMATRISEANTNGDKITIKITASLNIIKERHKTNSNIIYFLLNWIIVFF